MAITTAPHSTTTSPLLQPSFNSIFSCFNFFFLLPKSSLPSHFVRPSPPHPTPPPHLLSSNHHYSLRFSLVLIFFSVFCRLWILGLQVDRYRSSPLPLEFFIAARG